MDAANDDGRIIVISSDEEDTHGISDVENRSICKRKNSGGSSSEVEVLETITAAHADVNVAEAPVSEDCDIEVVQTRGALNLSHIRAHCQEYPFENASLEMRQQKCGKCYCFVCDKLADECESWRVHCNATDRGPDREYWKTLRRQGGKFEIIDLASNSPDQASGGDTPGLLSDSSLSRWDSPISPVRRRWSSFDSQSEESLEADYPGNDVGGSFSHNATSVTHNTANLVQTRDPNISSELVSAPPYPAYYAPVFAHPPSSLGRLFMPNSHHPPSLRFSADKACLNPAQPVAHTGSCMNTLTPFDEHLPKHSKPQVSKYQPQDYFSFSEGIIPHHRHHGSHCNDGTKDKFVQLKCLQEYPPSSHRGHVSRDSRSLRQKNAEGTIPYHRHRNSQYDDDTKDKFVQLKHFQEYRPSSHRGHLENADGTIPRHRHRNSHYDDDTKDKFVQLKHLQEYRPSSHRGHLSRGSSSLRQKNHPLQRSHHTQETYLAQGDSSTGFLRNEGKRICAFNDIGTGSCRCEGRGDCAFSHKHQHYLSESPSSRMSQHYYEGSSHRYSNPSRHRGLPSSTWGMCDDYGGPSSNRLSPPRYDRHQNKETRKRRHYDGMQLERSTPVRNSRSMHRRSRNYECEGKSHQPSSSMHNSTSQDHWPTERDTTSQSNLHPHASPIRLHIPHTARASTRSYKEKEHGLSYFQPRSSRISDRSRSRSNERHKLARRQAQSRSKERNDFVVAPRSYHPERRHTGRQYLDHHPHSRTNSQAEQREHVSLQERWNANPNYHSRSYRRAESPGHSLEDSEHRKYRRMSS